MRIIAQKDKLDRDRWGVVVVTGISGMVVGTNFAEREHAVAVAEAIATAKAREDGTAYFRVDAPEASTIFDSREAAWEFYEDTLMADEPNMVVVQ